MHERGDPVLEGRACLSSIANGHVLRCVPIENGRFEVSRLAPGRVRVTASAPGMIDAVRDVSVPQEGSIDLGDLPLADDR